MKNGRKFFYFPRKIAVMILIDFPHGRLSLHRIIIIIAMCWRSKSATTGDETRRDEDFSFSTRAGWFVDWNAAKGPKILCVSCLRWEWYVGLRWTRRWWRRERWWLQTIRAEGARVFSKAKTLAALEFDKTLSSSSYSSCHVFFFFFVFCGDREYFLFVCLFCQNKFASKTPLEEELQRGL